MSKSTFVSSIAKTSASPPLISNVHRRFYFPVMAVTSRNQDFPFNMEIVGDDKSLLASFRSLQRPYRPFPLLGSNQHMETIFASFFRSLPFVRYRRECLITPDGGSVALDWPVGDHRNLPLDAPLLILLPGLTGGSGDTYVRHMLMRARSDGWRVVVFNSRGCANSPVTSPQFYSASFTDDLRQVVAHVSNRFPCSKLYAVGWSLGANILVRYLGQDNPRCLLIVTPKGGHLGWIAGDDSPLGAPWTDPVIMEFLNHLQKNSHETATPTISEAAHPAEV